jgi:hypothetical protein
VRDDGTFIYRSGDGGCAVAFKSQDQTASLTYSGTAGLTLVSGSTQRFVVGPTTIGFFGTAAAPQPTVTGVKLPSDTVIASLLTALASLGLIVDSTT